MTHPINGLAAPAASAAPTVRHGPDRNDPLWDKAVKLEALLFQQLLDVADVGGLGTGTADGPGSRFDSLLREQYAQAVAGTGATGLAEALYRDLKASV